MTPSGLPMEFNPGMKLGLGFIVFGGSTSLLCVTGVILYIAVKRSRGDLYRADVSDSNLFLTLMVADFIHAIGVMFNVKWAVEGTISEGAFCTAQGVIKQIGNNGISFTSLVNIPMDHLLTRIDSVLICKAITIHTFLVLACWHPGCWGHGRHTLTYVIIAIWLSTGLLVAIPNIVHRHEAYYGNTGFWCYINSKYTTERLVTDYGWLWLTGLAMVILYPILAAMVYIYCRGDNETKHVRVAKKLLLFPIVYNLSILPNSLTRWLLFTHHNVPDGLILAANSLHASSGFLNFVVFCITRPAMVFGFRRRYTPNPVVDHSPVSPSSQQSDTPQSSIMKSYPDDNPQ